MSGGSKGGGRQRPMRKMASRIVASDLLLLISLLISRSQQPVCAPCTEQVSRHTLYMPGVCSLPLPLFRAAGLGGCLAALCEMTTHDNILTTVDRTGRLGVMLALTTIFFFVEIIVGYMSNSLSLVADSFHI